MRLKMGVLRSALLEHILQPELNLALRAGTGIDGALNRTESRVRQTLDRKKEVRMIREIEHLRTKLKAMPFVDFKEPRNT